MDVSELFSLLTYRSSSLAQVNMTLREQMDQLKLSNDNLTEDMRHLTSELHRAHENLEQQESEWRKEKEVISDNI